MSKAAAKKTRRLLLLPDVKVSMFEDVERLRDEKLLQEAAARDAEGAGIVSRAESWDESTKASYVIPTVFRGHDSWPSSSPLKCWQCDLYFEGVPFFLPVRIVDRDDNTGDSVDRERVAHKTTQIEVRGNICSPGCAKAYIDEHYRLDYVAMRTQDSLLVAACSIFQGRPVTSVAPAPSKLLRVEYSGSRAVPFG